MYVDDQFRRRAERRKGKGDKGKRMFRSGRTEAGSAIEDNQVVEGPACQANLPFMVLGWSYFGYHRD